MLEIFDWKEYASIAREAAAEGCVLLKNENSTLPVRKTDTVSVFGRIQVEYYSHGAGSGGMVNTPYVVSIPEGLEKAGVALNRSLQEKYARFVEENPFDNGVGWAQEPFCQPEMPLTDEIVQQAADASDIAVIVIGRLCGEDRDIIYEKGSYLLADREEDMIRKVCAAFERSVVLINTGGVIDMSWVEKYHPTAVMYVWQGGCEGGNGVADVLTGKVNPSGCMPDTIAKSWESYPSSKNFGSVTETIYQEDIYVGYRYFESVAQDQVLYPFGYGLSYTDFSYEVLSVEADDQDVRICAKVTNTGTCDGKKVLQVYFCPPKGLLGKPSRNLIRYGKTDCLKPGESQEMTFTFQVDEMASYDDSGITGNKSCFVLEEGVYRFFVGENVRDTKDAGSLEVTECVVVSCMEEALAPVQEFERMCILEDGVSYRPASLRTVDLNARIAERRPENAEYAGDLGYHLADVENGKISLETFLSQLTDEDLICMTRGEGMCSPKVTAGTAGAFGGVTDRLISYGIPTACCADGPAGIRMDCGTMAFGLPTGTLLASTFNTKIVEQLFEYEGKELRMNQIDTLLGPGINIHRNPLNGRNFEYFSEDPYLTGSMAVSELMGLHRYGVTGTIKHYVANDQETGRHTANSVVSERALREIYLKPFEMCVRQAHAYSIMSTYGPVNGIWTAGNYDLNTTILRDEWGFDGVVMTDWWVRINEEGEEGYRGNTIPMVRAQNDLNMVNGDALTNSEKDNSAEGIADGRITRGELLRNASNICRVLMKMPCMDEAAGRETIEWEERNRPEERKGKLCLMPPCTLNGYETVTLSHEGIDTSAGTRVQYQLTVPQKGIYEVYIKMRSDLGGVSQMNGTVSVNNHIMGSFSLTGNDGKWVEQRMEVPIVVAVENYMDFYFGQSGIEIGEISIKMLDTFVRNM